MSDSITMSIREYISLPSLHEFVLADVEVKVGDRFRIPDRKKHEELLLYFGVNRGVEAPFLEITKIGETEKGIPSMDRTIRIAKIVRSDDV